MVNLGVCIYILISFKTKNHSRIKFSKKTFYHFCIKLLTTTIEENTFPICSPKSNRVTSTNWMGRKGEGFGYFKFQARNGCPNPIYRFSTKAKPLDSQGHFLYTFINRECAWACDMPPGTTYQTVNRETSEILNFLNNSA